jgi:hypothetical protein
VSQRAALYTVRLRMPAGGAQPPLGTLRDAIAAELDGFVETSPDGGRSLRVVETEVDGDDVFAVLQHGEAGVAAEIVDADGRMRLQRLPDDAQLVRCACLFRLPAVAEQGMLVLHVNDGHGPKELLEAGLRRRLDGRLGAAVLELGRPDEREVLREAVAANRVEKVKLVKIQRAGDGAFAAVDKWVSAGDAARVELDVGGRIEPALIGRHLAGDEAAFAEIVEFAGLTFDQAKVQVRLADDSRRLFDLAHPGEGRPVTHNLSDLTLDADGEPTPAGLREALRALL